MIDANTIHAAVGTVIYGNLPILAAEGSALATRAATVGGDLSNAIHVDVDNTPTHPFKRTAKAVGVVAALGSEMTFGNELPVVALGAAASRIAGDVQPTGNPVVDSLISGALVASAVYPFSFYQQRLYGRVAQSAISDYPTTMQTTISSLRNNQNDEKHTHLEETDHTSDGNIAPLIGTTLALVAHKAKNPNSTTDQETRVIKRGAKLIAGTWAAVLGVATVVTTGADKIENSPVLQAVSNVKNPQILVPIAGGAYLLKEWYDLLRSKNIKPKHPQTSNNPTVKIAPASAD